MEQILIYLAIAFIVVLIIVLGITFDRLNKSKAELDEIENYSEKLVDYEMRNVSLQHELDDNIIFIKTLNEQLQKAESERDKLQSKLSRKGLGKKGRKKENVIIEQPIDDSQITEVEFEEYIDISEVKTLTDYIGYEFIAISHSGANVKGLICEDLTGSECIIVFPKSQLHIGWDISIGERTIPREYRNTTYNALFCSAKGTYSNFKSFKIIKK